MLEPAGCLPVCCQANRSSSLTVSRYAVTVCGLAWRCRASRSVKNPCRSGASELMAGLPGLAEPVCRQLEQLGGCLQIPVRRDGVDVPQVGGQQRQMGVDVHVGAVPAEHGRDAEGMP